MHYKIINQLISHIKKEQFEIDDNIPFSYLIVLLFQKIIAFCYGKIKLKTSKMVFVHPSVVIKCSNKIHLSGSVNIERGCFIDALSRDGLWLGSNVSFGFNTFLKISGSYKHLGNKIVIGNNVGLGSHGYFGCGVGYLEIGDDCIFGNYVSIHPENHNFNNLDIPIRLQGVVSFGGVKIGKNCWIGAKVTILDNTDIGDGCVVAAGAVVKGKFPANCIIGGVPAKILKYRTK